MDENEGDQPVIQAVDPMRRAWEQGVTRYKPYFRDQMMDGECGAVEVSLKNLRMIVKSGAKVCSMHGRRDGVLVCFCGGISYLATGFGAGHAADRPKLLGLAQFAAEVGLGDAEKIVRHFGAFPDDYEDELEFPVPGDLSLVK